MKLHYLFDPLCGWCYGASRLVHLMAQRLENNLPIELWPGALFPEPTPLQAGMRKHIVEADQRIAQLTGVEFGAAYLARIGDVSRSVTLWSVPVIGAIAVAPSAQRLKVMEAMQRAHYVEGRDLVDLDVLTEVAAGAGLDAASFAATMQESAHGQATSSWIRQARELMSRVGAGGYPSFVLERDGGFELLDHQAAYGNPESLVAELEALARGA